MITARKVRPAEWLGLAALAALAIAMVAASWRKWPDPLIDFGRELYVPWRLSHGALLYRDVEDIYGPLSQYLNAGLFAAFGPGLMVLVAANLAVFAAILGSIYVLFRRAWGPGAALVAGAVFTAVFGFSQFLGVGNYNYATPYSHEATHGMLVCLLLAIVLVRWVEDPTVGRSAAAGALLGLTAVLKPEAMLAGAAVTGAAAALRWRSGGPIRAGALAAGAACAALPTSVFAAAFARQVPAGEALRMACRGWLSIAVHAGFTRLPLQDVFLGIDRPWHNLAVHARATAFALLVIGAICGISRLADRAATLRGRLALAAALAAGTLALACRGIAWIGAGRCLLGLVLVYLADAALSLARAAAPREIPRSRVAGILAAVLAAAFMARMILNGRIYHYGFFEAALAAIAVPAVLIGELPRRLGAGTWGRRLIVAGFLLLLAPGIARLVATSQGILRTKTYAVGSGADRFYTFPPQTLATGDIVNVISGWLRAVPAGQTAVVLPEGEMINYLARIPSPIAPYAYFGAATRDGKEDAIVGDLQAHPPDWLVIVSRDMTDSGVPFYGEIPGEGLGILTWASDRYEPAFSVGGDPLAPDQCGGVVLRRRR